MTVQWWEDYAADWSLKTGRRTVTEFDILSFVTLIGMNEALFMDAEYIASDTPFGRRVAPGALVFSYAEGLVIQTGHLHTAAIAFLGAEMKMQAPVYLGDTIDVTVTLAERRETSKPDRGLVTTRNTVRNQSGAAVLEYLATRMLRRRPA
ncbi:MAG: MaoC family dehydratase [Immundisolibacter sp.]|uniref:MaoC family dehydratase n=1 Tax=Immundisolibacter sp. TaxID=1934948 RepID=UPI003D10AF69